MSPLPPPYSGGAVLLLLRPAHRRGRAAGDPPPQTLKRLRHRVQGGRPGQTLAGQSVQGRSFHSAGLLCNPAGGSGRRHARKRGGRQQRVQLHLRPGLGAGVPKRQIPGAGAKSAGHAGRRVPPAPGRAHRQPENARAAAPALSADPRRPGGRGVQRIPVHEGASGDFKMHRLGHAERPDQPGLCPAAVH